MKYIKDLVANPQNPRKISDEQLQILKKTLDTYGDLSGIVFNIGTGRLVGGHQRCKILPPDAQIIRTLTYPHPTEVGTVSEGYVQVGDEKIQYREVFWDEDTEKAANIAANKVGGEWDKSKLADWLLDLDSKGWDIPSTTGWTNEEFEDLCAPKLSEPDESKDVECLCVKCPIHKESNN